MNDPDAQPPITPVRDPAVDAFVTLLAGVEASGSHTDFYGQLCSAICESVALDRAVLFHYDPDLRTVRPLGTHGIALDVFSHVYVSPDTASFVRDALERDAIVEIEGPDLLDRTPDTFRSLAEGRRALCVPMISSGRWVGLMLADRADSAPPLTADERTLLLTLGKAVALATVARRIVRRGEETRMLKTRVDLAREVHDGVVQRLFGVSMALEGPGPLSPEDRARCAAEVQAAMVELRSVVGGRSTRPAPEGTIAAELARWSRAHPEVELNFFHRPPVDDAPAEVGALMRAALAEGLRNARKHGEPRGIDVLLHRSEGALELAVRNDGVGSGTRTVAAEPQAGVGLRLLGIEALQAGGVLEFGARGDDGWQLRLVVPVSDG